MSIQAYGSHMCYPGWQAPLVPQYWGPFPSTISYLLSSMIGLLLCPLLERNRIFYVLSNFLLSFFSLKYLCFSDSLHIWFLQPLGFALIWNHEVPHITNLYGFFIIIVNWLSITIWYIMLLVNIVWITIINTFNQLNTYPLTSIFI